MRVLQLSAVLIIFLSGTIFGQNQELGHHIDRGIALYDNGKYNEAIAEYKLALTIDNNSPAANYEMANTYIALKNYQEAVTYADKVIQLNNGDVDLAYTAKGNALDLMLKHGEAMDVYNAGIKMFPHNYLLLYNAALSCWELKKYYECASYAAKAVAANPRHASSHYLLGTSMCLLGKRPLSLMALYNFLLLEPNSKRSGSALSLLEMEMKRNVEKINDTIKIGVSDKDIKDEFGKIDLALSLIEATKNEEKTKSRSDEENFYRYSELFFSLLDEAPVEERNSSVWWTIYVPLFHDLLSAKNTQAFCYYILASKNSSTVNKWQKDHRNEAAKFSKWYADNYKVR